MLHGQVRYNIVIKHHYFDHLGDMCRTINAPAVSTYTEESFVAQGGRLYNHGCFGASTQHSVLSKYLIALQLKLELPSVLR
jgi:hypothetical protein